MINKIVKFYYKIINKLKEKNLLSLVVFLLLFLIVVVVYFPAIKSGFILDDNVWIAPLNLTQAKNLFIGSWEHGNALRPIMRLQFFSDRLIWKEWSVGWHLTTIFFHVLISFIGYLILKKIVKKEGLSFLGGLIFAIFPTNHEVVAWISGRTNSFALLVSILAWYSLYRLICSKKVNPFFVFGSFILLLCAYLTYEISFIVPVVLALTLIFFGPRNRRSYFIAGGAFLLLLALLIYRYQVLGGTFGSVGAQYNNIFLAGFYNFDLLKTLYWHALQLKIILFTICLIFAYLAVVKKIWKNYNQKLLISVFLFILSVLSYVPFVIEKGVAPRFLYSSLFFSFLGFIVFYDYLSGIGIKKFFNYILLALVIDLILFSFIFTIQVVNKYREIGNAYKNIAVVLRRDYPVWPENKDMLFYNIPDTNKGILAFLTYFEKTTKYNYGYVAPGRIYRADRLSKSQLQEVLKTNPVIYKFINFKVGILKISP